MRSRTRWRSRRVTRCRVTEPPTARLTTNPARAGASGSGEFAVERCTTSRGRPARRPRRTAEANSSRWVSREPAGSTGAAPLRPRAARGPCGGDRRRWRVRRGCASAAESRACAPGGGCSAGRCACPCSLLDSPGRRRGARPAAALLLVWTDTRFFRADMHRGTPDTARKPRVNLQRTQRRESRSNRPADPSHPAGGRLWPCRAPIWIRGDRPDLERLELGAREISSRGARVPSCAQVWTGLGMDRAQTTCRGRRHVRPP
jgi:hypothetical protein